MFKVKSYYVITSIHRNKRYYGSNFWDSGYQYTYTPISNAVRYIRETFELYNANKKISRVVDWCVVKSEDEEEIYIKIVGNKKSVTEFVKQLFERDPEFLSHFTMKPVPSYHLP